MIPSDGLNLCRIDDENSPADADAEDIINLTPIHPIHHWFAGTLTNLPPVRFAPPADLDGRQ